MQFKASVAGGGVETSAMRSAEDNWPLLHALESPADLRKLTVRQLRPLAAELRNSLQRNVVTTPEYPMPPASPTASRTGDSHGIRSACGRWPQAKANPDNRSFADRG